MARQIDRLKRERALLEEEILQLRAAVKIWTAVCHQTRSGQAAGDAFQAEIN